MNTDTSKQLRQVIPFRILRYILVIALIEAIVLLVFLKGGQQSESTKTIEEVSSAALANISLDGMTQGNERNLKKYYELDANDYDGFVLYLPTDSMAAEEILILKLADSSQAEDVVEAIKKRNTNQLGIFINYAPEQQAQLENCILETDGNYVIYIVHPEGETILQQFKDAL